MVPARTILAKTAAASGAALACIETAHGAAGSTQVGLAKNLWSPAAVGRSFDLSPGSLSPLERSAITSRSSATPTARGRGGRDQGDRRRSLPFERRLSHADAPEADRKGPTSRSASRSTRCMRSGSGRIQIPSMQLCIENVDQAGGCAYGTACVYTDTIRWATPDRAAAGDPRPARGVRSALRRRRHAVAAGGQPPHRPQHPRLGHRRSVAHRALARPGRPPPAGSALTDIRRSSGRIQRVESHNASGEPRDLPGAPMGVPDSFSEHVVDGDLQAVALRRRHHARLLVQARTRRLGPRLPGERRGAAVPSGLAPRRERSARPAVRADQQLTTSAWCRTSWTS